jgi:hypothetical protein
VQKNYLENLLPIPWVIFLLGGFGRLKDRVVLPAAVFAAWLNRINKVRKKSSDDRYVGKNMYFCTQ